MKVAFVIGHHKFSKGAKSYYLNKKEYDLFWGMRDRLEHMGDVYRHNPLVRGYNNRQSVMAKKTKNYDLVYELHFNSFNGLTKGCEALYHNKSEYGKLLSEHFCDTYTNIIGSKNRGNKALYDIDRGYGFVSKQKPVAIILEPFFGDNKEDSMLFDENIFLLSIEKNIDYYTFLLSKE